MVASEFEIIERYFTGLTASTAGVRLGIGDDAAVLEVPAGCDLVAASDMLVENVHFPAGADPGDVGFKAVAVNLSDLAAMGADPLWFTLSLALPEIIEAWLAGLASGLAAASDPWGLALVGGDTTRGPLTVSVQILGAVPRGRAVTRGGAQAGENLYVTGCLGAAGHALERLQAGDPPAAVDAACLGRLQRPAPRIEAGRRLRGRASAAIDVSDGLAADLSHLLRASGVGAEPPPRALPVCDAVRQQCGEAHAVELALSAGDDYELCFSAPADREDAIFAALGEAEIPVTAIGRTEEGEGIAWRGARGDFREPVRTGYRHF